MGGHADSVWPAQCFDVLKARVVQLEDRLSHRDSWESRRVEREAAEEAEEEAAEKEFAMFS